MAVDDAVRNTMEPQPQHLTNLLSNWMDNITKNLNFFLAMLIMPLPRVLAVLCFGSFYIRELISSLLY